MSNYREGSECATVVTIRACGSQENQSELLTGDDGERVCVASEKELAQLRSDLDREVWRLVSRIAHTVASPAWSWGAHADLAQKDLQFMVLCPRPHESMRTGGFLPDSNARGPMKTCARTMFSMVGARGRMRGCVRGIVFFNFSCVRDYPPFSQRHRRLARRTTAKTVKTKARLERYCTSCSFLVGGCVSAFEKPVARAQHLA